MANFAYEFAYSIYRGDKKQLKIRLKNADGTVLQPSTLVNLFFTAKLAPGVDSDPGVFQKKLNSPSTGIAISNDAAGECIVTILPPDTLTGVGLPTTSSEGITLYCFLKIVDAASDPYTRRVGTLTILPD